MRTHAATIRRLAACGDPLFTQMVEQGDVAAWMSPWPNSSS
jgi:hypothetical protein